MSVKWLRRSALLAAMAMASSVGTIGSASALDYGPKRTSFAGSWTPYRTAILGSRAEIEYIAPLLCGNTSVTAEEGNSVSTAWAMVADDRPPKLAGKPTTGFAQAGWIKAGKTADSTFLPATHEFGQWTRECKSLPPKLGKLEPCEDEPIVITGFGGSVENYSFYRAKWDLGDGKMYMYADNRFLTRSDYQPFYSWSDPWRNEYAGETRHLETNMPGSPSNYSAFGSLQFYDSFDVPKYIAPGSLYLDPPLSTSSYCQIPYDPASGTEGMKIWTRSRVIGSTC